MAEVVNLRLARKAKARGEAATKANANRAEFGRTRAEKLAAAKEATRGERVLDGAKRER